ncbi:pilus assembly protein [Moritella sp. 24]|uniref:TadE family protein n=1 Tax=Moritella sp. 24 TaxID=2746230 RepID=UPI001BAE2919|nr:TadE/TadG family type IV pilus assembly protein [Moritella sp. 24]QUM78040.1 pilus assembly protein [Moritella sp. 24]
MQNTLRYQHGIAAIESAIVAPLFCLLLLVILDGSRLIYAYGAISHAAREGVRYAVVRGTEAGQDNRRIGDSPTSPTQIETYVLQRSQPLNSITVTTTWDRDSNQLITKDAGQVVEVEVSHDFVSVTPFLPSITLSSTSSTIIYF